MISLGYLQFMVVLGPNMKYEKSNQLVIFLWFSYFCCLPQDCVSTQTQLTVVLLVCFVIIFNSLSRIRGEFFDMSPFIMVVCTMSRKSVTQTKFCCRPPRKKKKSRGRENSKNQMQSQQPIFFSSSTQLHAVVVPVVLYHI